MWICHQCAAHVKDDVLKCPCGASARLPSELAENVSTSAERPSPQKAPELIKKPVVPLLERQWMRRAFQIGALVGLLGFILCLPVVFPNSWWVEKGRLFSTIPGEGLFCLFVGGIFCVAVSAVTFCFFAVLAGSITAWFDRRFHPRRDLESPVAYAILAKTDSLGRRRQKHTKKGSGILNLRQSEQHAITDGNSEIQANRPDVPDR
jgi:hypothetical protein